MPNKLSNLELCYKLPFNLHPMFCLLDLILVDFNFLKPNLTGHPWFTTFKKWLL